MTHHGFDSKRLMLVLESGESGAKHSFSVAGEALAAGCKFIQFREKSMGDRDRLALLVSIVNLARQYDASVFVNDRVDLAILGEADGVHIGQDDIGVADARRIMSACKGEHMLIGQSVHTVDQAKDSEARGAHYVGCGALYSTATKADVTTMPLETLNSIAESVCIPVYGIGGITVGRVGDVLEAGAFGVAVSSAIVFALDPGGATQEFLTAIDRFV
ncbi:MAG: thiamine phosphate synthase [Candidatus Coatesbacteria bacterium]|nr:thiamine phosphate synthase [Candidatus Coatesbacteria bacterium]